MKKKITFEVRSYRKYFSLAGDHKQTLGRAKKRAGTYKYKYNGKELQDELGLNLYDYGARNFDPALGRWMNVDPLAEKYFGLSSYTYCLNNPISNFDPDGMDVYFVNEQGNFTLALKQKGKDKLYATTTDKFGITNIKTSETKNENGTLFNSFIEVNNGILGQFIDYKVTKGGYGFFSAETIMNEKSEDDMTKLFHFVANNTEVEFSMNFYKNEQGVRKIVLGTFQTETYSPGSHHYGITDKSQIIKKYHNHPPNQVTNSEEYHMGSDGHNAVDGRTTFPNYVFYPKSTNLYNVTMYGTPFVQKINKNYKNLKQ